MSRVTWAILWCSAALLLVGMIDVRPLIGLSATLLVSICIYMHSLRVLSQNEGDRNA